MDIENLGGLVNSVFIKANISCNKSTLLFTEKDVSGELLELWPATWATRHSGTVNSHF